MQINKGRNTVIKFENEILLSKEDCLITMTDVKYTSTVGELNGYLVSNMSFWDKLKTIYEIAKYIFK